MIGRARRSTLFPYRTLFRSLHAAPDADALPDARGLRGAADLYRIAYPHPRSPRRSEEHTSELQSRQYLVCRLLLEKNHLTQSATPSPTFSPVLSSVFPAPTL